MSTELRAGTQKRSQARSQTRGPSSTPKTTAKVAAKSAKAPASRATSSVMGMSLKTWTGGLRRAKGMDLRSGKRAFIFAFGQRSPKQLKKLLSPHLNKWQLQSLLESDADSLSYQGALGPVWILRGPEGRSVLATSLEKSSFARFRDLAGSVVNQLSAYRPEKLILELHDLTLDEQQAVVTGFEIAAYSFAENRPNNPRAKKKLPELLLKEGALTETESKAATELGLAVNLARHFTGLPGGDLNPRTYAESISALFSGSSTVAVDVWEGEKLAQEKMVLLIAVGQAAAEGPRFVHMRYRPKNAASGARPIALVGKGVTFDSGGLDVKPSSGMRLMKKDMGGSAAVVALIKWAERTGFQAPLDGYVSLAENAIGSRSFRPGDVLVSRNGLTVEISNTDAEGRLVLADALDVAVSQKGDDKPAYLINLATLTGAIKVGLGADIAGLFTNSDQLAEVLEDAGLARGDLMWRMPLFQPYRSQLKSTFADCNNCSDGSFGGAITAALFLEQFVGEVPWAHLDIYAWKDSANGAWSEAGGSGQPVLALTEALTRLTSEAGAEEMA